MENRYLDEQTDEPETYLTKTKSKVTRRESHVAVQTESIWITNTFVDLPAITLSIACSKCFNSTLGERYLAAINAASLHTLAMSAP